MRIDFEEIKKWPLTTNKIKVTVDEKKFFSEYSIVSYYSEDKEYKNLAYEQLSDLSPVWANLQFAHSEYKNLKFENY